MGGWAGTYLARLLANLTGDWALTRHELWVFVAGVVLGPCLALELAVLALGGADAAAHRALLEHEGGVGLALAILGPGGAALLIVLA